MGPLLDNKIEHHGNYKMIYEPTKNGRLLCVIIFKGNSVKPKITYFVKMLFFNLFFILLHMYSFKILVTVRIC